MKNIIILLIALSLFLIPSISEASQHISDENIVSAEQEGVSINEEMPESDVDAKKLAALLSELPDQIMAVLLAYLCFKTFIDMVK